MEPLKNKYIKKIKIIYRETSDAKSLSKIFLRPFLLNEHFY